MNDYLIHERQNLILKHLNGSGRVLATELAKEFSVSEDTIRRDLRDMAARGLCERVYGGALSLLPSGGTLAKRRSRNNQEKQVLARIALSQIKNGMSIFLDASSTNLAIARALPVSLEATIITNAPAIAAAMDGRREMSVIMIGGVVHSDVGGAVSTKAVADLNLFHPDLCILGACGVDPNAGLSCFHYDDALFKREVAARSKRVLCLMTTAKFRTRAPYIVISLSALDGLIVSPTLDEAAHSALVDANIPLIQADTGKKS